MSLIAIAHHSPIDLNWQPLLSVVTYAVLGVLLLVVFVLLVNCISCLDLRRGLTEGQNTSLGAAFVGATLAIAIIIAVIILS